MSGGYLYGEAAPTELCPYCRTVCEADFVDVGVGYQQCGPYHCEGCGASEIGPHDDERVLTKTEQDLGRYAPGKPPGSSANVIGGRIVTHTLAAAAYREEFTGNMLWADKAYVERWWKNLRERRT